MKYTYYVKGMHCKSCTILIESEFSNVSEVKSVKANLVKCSVEILGDFTDRSEEQIAEYLSKFIRPHGYELQKLESSSLTNLNIPKWKEFKIAIPVALGFIAMFIFLQKIGVINLITSSEVTYGTAFVVGLVASVSTCMAVVGGLVLSISASFAKKGESVRPQILFHVGRLVSFFILGGVIGAIGSVFQFGRNGIFVLSLIVAVVLLILGINLLDIFSWTKKIQPTLPSFIGKHIHGLKKMNHTLTPLLIGVATFFLPCGFTQSMQIYTLTTGSFWTGALTMLLFALGTLPVLALLSFGSLGVHGYAGKGIFFKTAGIIVIFFGIFNLINSLVVAGFIPPLFNL